MSRRGKSCQPRAALTVGPVTDIYTEPLVDDIYSRVLQELVWFVGRSGRSVWRMPLLVRDRGEYQRCQDEVFAADGSLWATNKEGSHPNTASGSSAILGVGGF